MITGTLLTPVILGTGQYGQTLSIAATGEVFPAGDTGESAIIAPATLSSADIRNRGVVHGAAGVASVLSPGGAGGDGIFLQTGGAISNAGSIGGGLGGYSALSSGGTGGIGIYARSRASIVNTGTVSGGEGGGAKSFTPSGNGGDGIDLQLGGSVVNKGVIQGGAGGASALAAGSGAAALVLGARGKVVNSGTIIGGEGGASTATDGAGADAVQLLQGGSLLNTGVITGGGRGGVGVFLASAAMLANGGTITGGAGSDGVTLSAGGEVDNHGSISGGVGAYGGTVNGRSGGTALASSGPVSVVTSGVVTGGAGGGSGQSAGGAGGVGISLSGVPAYTIVETFANMGVVSGGAGGSSLYGTGGAGGAGGYFYGRLSAVNDGKIVGGAGGANADSAGHAKAYGGVGGDGVVLEFGTLVNTGLIEGGAGRTGGAGVYIHGGLLVAASGTITGGVSDAGGVSSTGYAVVMGEDIGATLEIDPGAVFVGGIYASYSVDDRLQLASGTGSLSGLGIKGGVFGFSSIEVESHAHWTLTGTINSDTPILLEAHAFVALSGSDAFVPVLFASGGGDVLRLDTPSTFIYSRIEGFGAGDAVQVEGIQATSFTFSGDELSLLGSNGATLYSLSISSHDSSADFGIKLIAGGTEVYWAGGGSVAQAELPGWHFPLNI